MDLVVPGFKSYLQHGTDGEGRRRKEPRYQHNPTITFVSEYHYVFEFEIDTLLNLERVDILPGELRKIIGIIIKENIVTGLIC